MLGKDNHLKSRINYLINIFNSSRKHLFIKLFLKELKTLNKTEIINHLSSLRIKKNTNSISFLGSGESVLNSLKILSSREVIIGGNLTCLLPIYQDVYFTEWSGKGHKQLIPHLNKIYTKRSKYIGFLINKSLSQEHNKIPFASEFSLTKYYLYEASRAILNKNDINIFMNEALDKKRWFVTQSLSSLFTAISLAYLSGYSQINLFGVDFGGQYFWDTDAFKGIDNKMCLPNDFPRGYKYGSETLYAIRSKTSKHETSEAKISSEIILNAFSERLKNKNFNILNRKDN